MTINYAALQTELKTDPSSIGYSGLINATPVNWDGVMNLLNTPTSKLPSIQHEAIDSAAFKAEIKPTELQTLTTTQLQQVGIYATSGNVDVGDSDVQAWINILWPSSAAPFTNANLTALATRLQSPAELLFGVGFVITNVDDVIRAYKSGQ